MTDRTMRSVSQRNPADSGNVFGRFFRRGPEVAADGGEPDAGTQTENDADAGTETDKEAATDADRLMKHVDQTPPVDDTEPNRVWERGNETVAEDE